MHLVQPRKNLSANTDRGPSPSLWSNCPWMAFLQNPQKGIAFHEDFELVGATSSAASAAVIGSQGRWAVYRYQGSTVVSGDVTGGAITIGSDDDNEGVALHSNAGAGLIATGGGRVWFECRLKHSTITDTKNGVFVGLMEGETPTTAQPLGTDGALADFNMIGWHRLEGDGDEMDFTYKADGQTAQSILTDGITAVSGAALSADTFVKVGFYFNRKHPTAQRIKLFVNGQVATTYVTGTQMDAATFPDDMQLSPVIGIMNATGTSPGTCTVDWIRVAFELDEG